MKEGEEADKLEKVISSIKECNNNVPGRCDKCPYRGKDTHDCVGELLNDALELLKEHKEHEELLNKLGYHWAGSGETLALCKRVKDGDNE